MRLKLGLGLIQSGGLPYLPSGYAFLVDSNGEFEKDHNGKFLVVKE